MDKKSYRKAYKEAVEQLSDEQTKQIKELVKQGLEKLQTAEKERQVVVKKIQLLKKDLEDLREGRLDQIKERHTKDKDADRLSPISPQVIEKIIIIENHQTVPFPLSPTVTASPFVNGTVCDGFNWGGCNSLQSTSSFYYQPSPLSGFGTTSASIGQATIGTYVLADGTVKYF